MNNSINILVLNGPNLNLTGTREPHIYGALTLEDINGSLIDAANSLGVGIDFYQSNHEGDIIDKLHSARFDFDGIILNAGAFTHYSYAIRDAIASIGIPVVEVHMSNVHAREEFRHISVISPVCIGTIAGFGSFSYHLALAALMERFKKD
ncbi:MAG: type II 3-dehydroquinate dehydratase [Clostridia bacterium]|nr:type II 3-dehydroquinate dehydratase [Clostridia bacterium]